MNCRHSFRLVLVLAVTSMACSSSALQQRPLVPRVSPHEADVRVVQSMSATSRAGVEVTLRQGAMRFTLFEQGALVRLDVNASNDGTRALGLPPSLFTVRDADGTALSPLAPHEAANQVLAGVGASLSYTEKRQFTSTSYSNSASVTSDADAWSKLNGSIKAGSTRTPQALGIERAREIYDAGLTADATVAPRESLRGSVYFARTGGERYPLELSIPPIGRSFVFDPGAINSAQHVAMATGVPEDTSPFVPSDQRIGGGMAVMVYGSWAQYAMNDVNDEIDAVNELVGDELKPIEDGFGVGIDMMRQYSRTMAVGIGVEKLFGKTEYSDDTDTQTLNAGGWGFRAIAQVAALQNARFRVAVEAGAGLVLAAGKSSSSTPGGDFEASVGGMGLLAQGGIPIEFAVTPRLSMFTRAGYRYANVSTGTIDGEDMVNLDGDPIGLDYSGIYSQVGVSIR